MKPTHSEACNRFMILLKIILEECLLLLSLLKSHRNTEWTLDELRASIMKEFQILKTELHSSRYHDEPTHSDIPPITTGSFYTDTRRHSQQSPNTGHANQFKDHKTCVYCKQQHSYSFCDVITIPQDRLAIVKKNNLCFNCLAHHKISQCNSKYKYKVCKQKHHKSLCNNSVPPTLSDAKSESMKSDTNKRNKTTVTFTLAFHNSNAIQSPIPANMCLLKTAIATISSHRKKSIYLRV